MAETLFDEMKRYVGFGPRDEAVLRRLKPRVEPEFQAISEEFYARMEGFPQAKAVFSGPEQVERLKRTLVTWLDRFFTGPWDETYFELRARIGRRHVAIELPQQYMFMAMNVIRQHLVRIITDTCDGRSAMQEELSTLHKLVDMELAIMLHTYREDYLAQMRGTERLATLGQVAGSIGHELRNPLGVIESSAYLLKRKLGSDASAARHLGKIEGQVHDANRIISNLLDLVRERPPKLGPVDPTDISRAAVEGIELTSGGRVALELADDLPAIHADGDQVRQILLNLLTNAVDATGEANKVRLRVERDDNEVRFLVIDEGPGIEPDVARRLFEPLVSTKVNGVGLGLALCRKLATAQRGHVGWVPNSASSGTTFELRLPAAQ